MTTTPHRRFLSHRLLGGIGTLGLLAATASVTLLSAPSAATAATALPCTYSETIDENGNYVSALPGRATADTAMAVYTHRASAQTPEGKIAVVYAIANSAHYRITSITATDSDGTFTTTGPSTAMNFDATTHTSIPAGVDALGAFPTATIHSVTICAADVDAARAATPCTQVKTAHYADGAEPHDDFTGDASFFNIHDTGAEVAPPHLDLVEVFGQDIFNADGRTLGSVTATSLTGTDSDGTTWTATPTGDDKVYKHTSVTGDWITTATIMGCYTPLVTTMTAPPTTTPSPTPMATPAVTTTPASAAATASAAAATAADPTTTPGGTETVSAGGFKAGETVSAVLHSSPVKLGNFTANASGVVTVPFTIPATLETGAHSVIVTGLTSGHVATAHFTVAAAPADLASTGVMHTGALLATGVGTVGLGVGVLAFTMWRRRMTPQH